MNRLWACLLLSLGLHLAFFPGILEGLMAGVSAAEVPPKPERVKVRLVKRPAPKRETPKPKPSPVVKPPQAPKPPKMEAKPRPVARPAPPKPAAAPPKPAPRKPAAAPPAPPKPAAAPPAPPKPAARPSYPTRKPTLGVASNVPKAKPASSGRRLTTTRPNGAAKRAASRPALSEQTSGRTGLEPAPAWSPPPPSQPNGSSGGTEGEGTSAPVTAEPVPPQPAASRPVPPAPIRPSPRPSPPPAAPAPRPKPAQPKPAQPKPAQPKPEPVAARAQKAAISVPTIDPPAQFRRQKLKGELWVRFSIEASGEFTVSLFQSSGNPDFDEFVLAEVRRTARVEPAVGDDGRPKRSSVRRPVEINID